MATKQSVMAVISASRPTFRNRFDKIAFVIHAAFLSADYVLNATGPAAFADDALSSTSSDEVGIDNWNDLEDNYAFLYSNREKPSEKVLVKCLVMMNKVLVSALKKDGPEPVHLEINVEEYVGEDGGTNYHSQFRNLGKLVAEVDKKILGKFTESSKAGSLDQPSRVFVPPVPTFGASDLFPGPGAGMYPNRGGFDQGGSMLVGPNDPRFFDDRRNPGFPGLGGIPGVPPGARFDPYGPPGVPGFEPGRFVRNPRRPGGGTHPDLEHFGSGSDFM